MSTRTHMHTPENTQTLDAHIYIHTQIHSTQSKRSKLIFIYKLYIEVYILLKTCFLCRCVWISCVRKRISMLIHFRVYWYTVSILIKQENWTDTLFLCVNHALSVAVHEYRVYWYTVSMLIHCVCPHQYSVSVWISCVRTCIRIRLCVLTCTEVAVATANACVVSARVCATVAEWAATVAAAAAVKSAEEVTAASAAIAAACIHI